MITVNESVLALCVYLLGECLHRHFPGLAILLTRYMEPRFPVCLRFELIPRFTCRPEYARRSFTIVISAVMVI